MNKVKIRIYILFIIIFACIAFKVWSDKTDIHKNSVIIDKTFSDKEINVMLEQADLLSEQFLLLAVDIDNIKNKNVYSDLSDSEIYKFLMSMYSYNCYEVYPYKGLSSQENTGHSVVNEKNAQFVVNELFGISDWCYEINDQDFDYFDNVTKEYKSQRDIGGRGNNISILKLNSYFNEDDLSVTSYGTIVFNSYKEELDSLNATCDVIISYNIINCDMPHLQFIEVQML